MLYCLQGILVVFPQLLFSILDNWSSVLLVPFFTDILYSYLDKGKKEKEHDFCLKSMQVCEWDDMLVFIIWYAIVYDTHHQQSISVAGPESKEWSKTMLEYVTDDHIALYWWINSW
jgi:hypothetical protein